MIFVHAAEAQQHTRRPTRAQNGPTLHIDVPVKLEKANVVFDIGNSVQKASGGMQSMGIPIRDVGLLASDSGTGTSNGTLLLSLRGRSLSRAERRFL
jgi:hypothetical protein